MCVFIVFLDIWGDISIERGDVRDPAVPIIDSILVDSDMKSIDIEIT